MTAPLLLPGGLGEQKSVHSHHYCTDSVPATQQHGAEAFGWCCVMSFVSTSASGVHLGASCQTSASDVIGVNYRDGDPGVYPDRHCSRQDM
jgi:hypothetical protein